MPVGLSRVERRDDVGMQQFGRRFHLASKSLDRLSILKRRGGQNLDRHDPVHPAMASLVHLSHAAGADPVQDHVITQHQCPRFAGQDLPGLKSSQLLSPHQSGGQLLRILAVSSGLLDLTA